MKEFVPVPEEVERVAKEIVDAAFKVHKTLGPGLLEAVYEACLTRELELRGLSVERQVPVPIVYEGAKLDAGLRLDMLVSGLVVVEIKAVEKPNPVFDAQLLSYLRLSGRRLGLLINFTVPVIKAGIKRIVV
jgi:GxxExxY protein